MRGCDAEQSKRNSANLERQGVSEMGETEQSKGGGTELGLTEQAGAAGSENSGENGSQTSGGVTYDLDGEQITAEQIKEWKAGHMLQADYTRKTQELAAQREQLKPVQETLDYLKANPDKAQQVYNALYGQNGEVDPIQQQLRQTQQMVNQLIKESSLQKVNSMVDSIKNDPKYGELFKDAEMEELLLATAMQTGKTNLGDLKGVADRLFAKVTKFQVKAEQTGAEKTVKNLQSPTRKGEAGKGTYSPPKDFDPTKVDAKTAREVAASFL